MRYRMIWLSTLRKKILNMTQKGLSDEIYVSQTCISRAESGSNKEPISNSAYLHLIDLVKTKTGKDLPYRWYFTPPSSDDVLQYFHDSNIDPAARKGTGKAATSLPPRDCYSSQKGVSS